VREEGQPAQDDPGAQQSRRDSQQERRQQRALHEREREGIGQPAHVRSLSKMVLI
jgi:hypothetical protein